MRSTAILALVGTFLACGFPSLFGQANEVLVCGFEDQADTGLFAPGCTITLTPEHATQGAGAARVEFAAPLAISDKFPSDWRLYKAVII